MNQTEKVAKWLFESEQERVDGDDWDSIQGRPLWEKMVRRYLAKAKEILSLIDQQAEPVAGVNANGIVEWYDMDLEPGSKLYVHPPVSWDSRKQEPELAYEAGYEAGRGGLKSLRAAISRLFEEVDG